MNKNYKVIFLLLSFLLSLPMHAAFAQVADDAACQSNTLPSTMTPGESKSVTITLKNTGASTWETATSYYLYLTDWPDKNSKWSPFTQNLTASVAPSQNATFTINLTAPQTAGTYNVKYQMVRGGVATFGESCGKTITVESQTASPVADEAVCQSNTLPNTMSPGESKTVTVTIKNSGSATWTTADSYYLFLTDWSDKNSKWLPLTENLSSAVSSNQNATFTINLTAPQTAGTYNVKYQMVRGGVATFGESCGKSITVQDKTVPDEKIPITGVNNITPITADANASSNATFQSYNQKVVTNKYGIFITYLHSNNVNYDQNVWRLARSTDGGKTFSTIYEATHGTNPPVIETDSSGVIYVAHPDWGVGYTKTDALLYRFLPSNNFSNPTITSIPNSAAGKYSLVLDEQRNQLYYFSHGGYFSIIGTDGVVKKNYLVLIPGTSAGQQYPMLYMAQNGDLYVAWTTSKLDAYMYWDIHYMRSKDGGLSWETIKGTKLSTPIVADDSGPTDRITLDDEFNVHTWLSSFVIKNNKAHFFYWAQIKPRRQHYMRYDLTTGKRDIDIMPEWKGESISLWNLDGFCATKKSDSNSNLYCTSLSTDNRVATLYSTDNGETWHDFAQTPVISGTAHQIGGAREISADGYITGTYTEISPGASAGVAAVKFFRVPITPPKIYPTPQTYQQQTRSTSGGSSSSGGSGSSSKSTNKTVPSPVAPPKKTSYDFGTTTLKNGSKGEAVMELQRFLNAKLNLGLVVDGKLGPKTIAVIKTWQRNNGLLADGLIGPKTKAMMNVSAR